MRALKLLLIICLVSGMLYGCTQSMQLENQAYVLTIGLDRLANGEIEITAQVPRIASSGEQESAAAGKSGGNYFRFSARGNGFEDALEKLEWIIPRRLNLSHLKLIVLSEELASGKNCRDLLYDITHTEQLFSAARVAVCEGKAKDFIAETKPVIGSRLSTDILSTFDHFADQGLVPDSNLADLYYATESVYSDPMAAYAILGSNKESKPAFAAMESAKTLVESTESELSTHFMGAALFSEGICVGVFSPQKAVYANLLSGSLRSFRYSHDGQGLEIFPEEAASIDIDLNSPIPKIHVVLHLSISAQEDVPDLESLQVVLEKEIANTISFAQQAGAEPFGFAETAASQFLTLDDWVNYDWKKQFPKAEIQVQVHLRRTGT